MKKYIPYAIAALTDFHLRWTVSALNGWSYSMNGADIIVAIFWNIFGDSYRYRMQYNEYKKKRMEAEKSGGQVSFDELEVPNAK